MVTTNCHFVGNEGNARVNKWEKGEGKQRKQMQSPGVCFTAEVSETTYLEYNLRGNVERWSSCWMVLQRAPLRHLARGCGTLIVLSQPLLWTARGHGFIWTLLLDYILPRACSKPAAPAL